MHYFQFNIKSYQAATLHLSNEEDLAYRRLLDHYYDTEQPIKAGANPVLCRRLRVGLPELESVLSEFFELVDDCWKSEYCEGLLVEYRAYTERQRTNGSKGGRGHKADAKPDKPTALPKKPSAKPTTNQEPLTTNQEPNKKTAVTSRFILPDWVNAEHWDTWHSGDKRKKATDRQKQMAVEKLDQWRLAGENHVGALENAAMSGYQGLFLPTVNPARAGTETNYARSMREKMEVVAPMVAAKKPGEVSANAFFDVPMVKPVEISHA